MRGSARRITWFLEFQLVWKTISPIMCDKPSRFRDSETVPEGTEFCNKMSAKTSEVASPVQFLSDSDETEENLSPALVPQFRKLPGVILQTMNLSWNHLMMMTIFLK